MVFYYDESFKKDFQHLHKFTQKNLFRQLETLLLHGVTHPSISASKMTNLEDGIWELRVDLQYRVTFTIGDKIVVLRRIGVMR